MSGGKGGSQTSEVTIPEYIEKAAQANLNKAEKASQIGFVPSYGPSVAAFTPMANASFDNTANAASAFGMTTPAAGSSAAYGGMGPATDFGNGVMGYSAKPLYDNMMSEFAADRPGQYNYINSFFIDPYAGTPGANVPLGVDYNNYATANDMANAQMANDLAIAQAQANAGPSTVMNTFATSGVGDINSAVQPDPTIFNQTPASVQNDQATLATNPGSSNYADAFGNVYDAQAAAAESDPFGQSTGFGITTDILDQTGGAEAWLPGADMQATEFLTNPDPSITDPSTAGIGTQFGNDLGEAISGIASSSLIGNLLFDESEKPGGVNNPIETPTLAEMIAAAPPGMTYDFTTGAYVDDPSTGPDPSVKPPSSPGSTSSSTSVRSNLPGPVEIQAGDTLSAIAAANNVTVDQLVAANNINDPNKINAGDELIIPISGDVKRYSGSKVSSAATSAADENECVVATHAVAAGAFNYKTKRQAVVWCMHNLHDRWWGEAIRRGYRHLGRKKIEQGKAAEHYSEFRGYIDFATGRKRTLKGALHFAARSVQFLVVGLVKGDA